MTDSAPKKKAGDRPAWRRRLPAAVRLFALAVIVVWLFRFADLDRIGAAFASISPLALLSGIALAAINVSMGGLRWRISMRAFGAHDLPRLRVLVRLFFVGLFYNTFVPGSVGGDIVRGAVIAGKFPGRATGMVVVFLERLIGLSALGLVFVAGVLFGRRIIEVSAILPWITVAVTCFLLMVSAWAVTGGRLEQWRQRAPAKGRLAQWWRQLPYVYRPLDLIWVFAISVIGHLVSVLIIWLLAGGMGIALTFEDALLVVPLALLAAVLPIALAGVGPREAALVGLLVLLGIDAERGLALSLSYTAIMLALAAVGGLFQLLPGAITVDEDRGAAP